MEIGEKIRKARKARGLTQEVLGELVGITHSAVSQIENNKNDISKKTLIALAKVLNDNFGESWLDEYLSDNEPPLSKQDIVKDMSVREFVELKSSLTFGGKQKRRSKAELEMLTKLLEAEFERMNNDE